MTGWVIRDNLQVKRRVEIPQKWFIKVNQAQQACSCLDKQPMPHSW